MFGSLAPIPETSETLHAQQRQMMAGHRAAQLFPGGRGELPRPAGIHRTVTANGDVFHFVPSKVSEAAIHHASMTGTENRVLGLGPVSKHEAMQRIARGEKPIAVVERSPSGTELRAASGTHMTASDQVRAMNGMKSPDSTVSVEHPVHTVARRVVGVLNGAA